MKGQSLLLPLFCSLGIHGLLASFLLPPSPKKTSGNLLTVEVIWAKKEDPSLPQEHKKTKAKKIATVSHAKRSSPPENKNTQLDDFTTTKAGSRTDEVSIPIPGTKSLQKGHRQTHHPLPEYPWVCRKRNQEGVVTLKVITNEDGQVRQVALQKSSGYERLDKAALQVIKSWIFAEGKLQKIVRIAFRLDPEKVQHVREGMTTAHKT